MDFSAGIAFFFGQLEQAAVLARLAFLAHLARRGAGRLRRCTSSGSGTSAAAAFGCARSCARCSRAASCAHRSNQADIGYLFFNVFVFSVVFGWAVLSYQFISNGIIAGLVALAGPVDAVDAAGLRHALGHHRDAVPRLRARLLVQPLAQPQGAAAVGIPQSAPHRGSAHAAHQFPRPSGLHLDLRQHPRASRRRSPTASAITCSATPPINTRSPTPTSSWCCSSTLTSTCSIAHVDFVPRRARAHFRFARASSGASLGRSETLQQEFRQLPGAVGLDVRHALHSGEGTRAAGVRLCGSPERAHGQGRAGGAAGQCRRPSQAAAGPSAAPIVAERKQA